MGLAVVAVVGVVLLGMVTTPASDRVIWAFVGLLLLWAVAGVGLWATHHYRATTPELAHASATRYVLMSPLTFAVAALVSWLLDGDVGQAIWMGACATGGLMLAAFATKWIAGRE